MRDELLAYTKKLNSNVIAIYDLVKKIEKETKGMKATDD